jgi:undecaprenyl-diphosphatase
MEEILHAVGAYGTPLLVVNLVILLCAVLGVWQWLEISAEALFRWASTMRAAVVATPPVAWLGRRFPRLRRFLGRRLSPESYLGIHVTIGLTLLVTAVFLFGLLAREIGGDTELGRFDLTLANVLHQTTSPGSVNFFLVVTWIGNGWVVTVLCLAIGVWLFVRHQRLLLTAWVFALAGGGILNWALKAAFQRARPTLQNPFAIEPGWSFPSGHAMGAVFTYGMLAYLLILAVPSRWHSTVVALAAALVMLIGASRVYLGVHYFSDVIAGFVAGTAWLATCVTATETARRHRRGRQAPRSGLRK